MKDKEEIIVVSVGGSLIVPNQIDSGFLGRFRNLILQYLKKNKRFVIVCGGGKTARNYQDAAKSVVDLKQEDADWLGIHATRINAHLMRVLFADVAHVHVIKNPTEKIDFKEKILVAAGWEPGWSTDYDAVLLAKSLGVKKVVNLSNIDYVYDKDPNKFTGAKPIKKTSWKEFRLLLPKKWSPGLNSPFDPIAAKEAEDLGIEVAIMNGSKLDNFEKYLDEDDFQGTIIN